MIIIDNGSGTIKAGAGGDTPEVNLSSVVGKSFDNPTERVIGDEAFSQRNVDLRYPIERGLVTDWESMEAIWTHAINELNLNLDDHPMILTEPPRSFKSSREKKIEIMMETFAIPGIHFKIPAVLSLHASGRFTGIVLDSGEDATYSVPIYESIPIYESYSLSHAVESRKIGGRDVDDCLQNKFLGNDYSQEHFNDRRIIRNIKETHCYISQHFNEEINKSFATKHELPDGTILDLEKERFEAPEILFQPSLIGIEESGCAQMLSSSVTKCDIDIRSELFSNIVLAGGCTMFPGFSNRFNEEIRALAPPTTNLNVIAPENRVVSAWVGGTVLAALPSFLQSRDWFWKEDYDDCGPHIIYRKCNGF